MSKNIIQSIVVILGILILIAFLTLIYGMYLKISISNNNFSPLSKHFSINLTVDEKIKNIEVLNKENLLILIESDEKITGAIYNIDDNEIPINDANTQKVV